MIGILPVLFWLIAGIVAGLVSGAMAAKYVNDLKRGQYFHAGNCAMKDLAGGVSGVAAAYVLTGFHYFGGFLFLLILIPIWVVSEKTFKRYLIANFDKANPKK